MKTNMKKSIKTSVTKNIKSTLILVLIIGGITAGIAYQYTMEKQVQPQFITDVVKRGNIENVVLTNGVLYPSKLVNVGAQVSGLISKMNVQLGDEVKQGDLLLKLII